MFLFWADHHDGATTMNTVRRLLIQRALGLVGLVAVVLQRACLRATAGDVVLVHHSFSVQVVAVDPGITEIAPFDFYEIAYTIDQSVTDQNSSIGAGTFPALATAFSLAARPLNAAPWHPMGTFNLAGSNYVTNAFGDNYTFQMRGSGFPNGGPGLAFFDLDLNWSWPSGISDSGLNDQFAVQLVGGGVVDLTRAVMRPSHIRFRTSAGEFREATILPETPTLGWRLQRQRQGRCGGLHRVAEQRTRSRHPRQRCDAGDDRRRGLRHVEVALRAVGRAAVQRRGRGAGTGVWGVGVGAVDGPWLWGEAESAPGVSAPCVRWLRPPNHPGLNGCLVGTATCANNARW